MNVYNISSPVLHKLRTIYKNKFNNIRCYPECGRINHLYLTVDATIPVEKMTHIVLKLEYGCDYIGEIIMKYDG